MPTNAPLRSVNTGRDGWGGDEIRQERLTYFFCALKATVLPGVMRAHRVPPLWPSILAQIPCSEEKTRLLTTGQNPPGTTGLIR